MIVSNNIITIAMPYINGIIHIGHLYEYYYANVLLILKKKYFFCKISTGLDCHGLIKKNNLIKLEYFNKKKVFYFNFKTIQKKTNSLINKRISNWIFNYLIEKNKIYSKTTFRIYNKKNNFYVPDKYILIKCNKCLNILENIYCIFCDCYNILIKKNINCKYITIKKNNSFYYKNYTYNDWDITRNYFYYGFKIISKKTFFFYVWYDALISYISNNIYFLKNTFNKIIIQIIGKDILYFHILYNTILKFLKFKKTFILVHHFIKKKKKISKSEKIKIQIINKKLLKFFFLISERINYKDIKYNVKILKLNYKKIYINKIINFLYRIKSLFLKYDNNIIDFFFIKNNCFFYYIFKKNNFGFLIKKKIKNILILNKLINLNKFWTKKNYFLINYIYSKIFFFYLKNLNFLFLVINNKKILNKLFKNSKIFNLKKI